jgi:hypothetical protein
MQAEHLQQGGFSTTSYAAYNLDQLFILETGQFGKVFGPWYHGSSIGEKGKYVNRLKKLFKNREFFHFNEKTNENLDIFSVK